MIEFIHDSVSLIPRAKKEVIEYNSIDYYMTG